MMHAGRVPSGLDGNPNPIVSPERSRLLGLVAAEIGAGPALVAIDGASGTGKSTFADELARTLERGGRTVVRAGIDSFHRPRAERYQLGPESAEGYYRDSHDLAGVRRELLDPFAAGAGSFRRAIFDEPSDQPLTEPAERVPSDGVLVFDGLFLHRPELVDMWTLSIFLVADARREAAWQEYLNRDLPTDPGERAAEIARRVARARRPRYVDGQALYERAADPRTRANVVIDNDDLGHPRIVAMRESSA